MKTELEVLESISQSPLFTVPIGATANLRRMSNAVFVALVVAGTAPGIWMEIHDRP